MPGIKLTKVELTYRSDFIDILRRIFLHCNLDVKDEIRIHLYGSKEKVLVPDLLILERGKYEEKDDALYIRPGGLKGYNRN